MKVCTLPAEVKQVAAEEVNELSKTDQKTVKNLLKGEQLRAELINRRESYIKNAKTASACQFIFERLRFLCFRTFSE